LVDSGGYDEAPEALIVGRQIGAPAADRDSQGCASDDHPVRRMIGNLKKILYKACIRTLGKFVHQGCAFPDRAAFCCIPLPFPRRMASAILAPRPGALSIFWQSPDRSCGRCCRWGPPAMANRPINAFRLGRAIRCSSAWKDLSNK